MVRTGVTGALEFLNSVTLADGTTNVRSDSYQALSEEAASRGFTLTHRDLAGAMKLVMDRSRTRSDVPSWIRARALLTLHD
jgi:hypothetical protein